MNPARFSIAPKSAVKAALSALASGLLLSGCYYYGYPPYPAGYYSPVVPAAYTQREFTLPPGTASATGASGVPTASAVVPASSSQAYFADYYATPAYSYYPYPAYAYAPYPYAPYPAYYGYGYGYPAISIGFGYWGGGGCCWGRGYYHGGGWHGNGWHGGGGGWNGGGWHGGGGWQGGVPRSSTGMRPR
jgi:hypothetical protein